MKVIIISRYFHSFLLISKSSMIQFLISSQNRLTFFNSYYHLEISSKFATFDYESEGSYSIVKKDGWIEKTQNGSHLQLTHPTKQGKVTVPIHGGDIPKGTLNFILKQSGLK